MTSDRRRILFALLLGWAIAVFYVTLAPAGYTPPLTLEGFLCVACGELDVSDMIGNWVLFVPGGLLATLLFGPRRGLLLPICLTGLVELIQIGVPGRDPALQDVIFNSVGALTGLGLAVRGLPPWGRWLVSALAGTSWLAPLLLLIPQTTAHDLHGLWTPRLGSTVHYEGEILSAQVGHVTVQSRRTDEKPALDRAIRAREPVRIVMRAGQKPPSWAPIFHIADSEQQGILELGALHSDLILRGRNPARALKLDQPDVRWPEAMADVSPGDTITLVVDRSRDSVCMSIDDRERCNLAPSLGDGWAFVLNLEGPPLWFRELMSLAWAASLGGLIGLNARSWRRAPAIGMVLAAIGYLGALVSPDVTPSALHALFLVAGAGAGGLARAPLISFWRTLRTEPRLTDRPST